MKSILAPLALMCAAVQAQPAQPVQPALPVPPPPAALASLAALAGGPWKDERVIQGAPYCADAVHETVQALADGNRIVRRQTARLCRDGQGRTRQEVERGGRRVVYLHDPVTRERWLLDPERREARRSAGSAGFHVEQLIDGEAWREYGERMREWARGFAERMRAGESPAAPPAPAAPPVPPAPAVVRPLAPAAPGIAREVEVQVLRLPEGEPALAPPAVRWSALVNAPRGPGVTTPLPPREIEGVRAHGERTTWTIEAGALGNEKPIEIVREVWSSPELMLTVATRDFDPRSGEVSYRLQNLRRAEPDPALMKVPEGFSRK